jgi:hypothetical protein
MTVSVHFLIDGLKLYLVYIQMYHEEMQVKFEYGCDPIIIEGVIAFGLRKLLENEFLFIFSLMV